MTMGVNVMEDLVSEAAERVTECVSELAWARMVVRGVGMRFGTKCVEELATGVEEAIARCADVRDSLRLLAASGSLKGKGGEGT